MAEVEGFERPRTHARFWRTASTLAAVTITLARQTPSTRITVGAITRDAKINRSTFYTHSADPTSLLRRAMRAALDEDAVTTNTSEHVNGSRSIDHALCLATNHVNQFREVYRTALSDDTAAASLFAGLTNFLAQQLGHAAANSSTGSTAALAAAISQLIKNALAGAHGRLDAAWIRAALHDTIAMLSPTPRSSTTPDHWRPHGQQPPR